MEYPGEMLGKFLKNMYVTQINFAKHDRIKIGEIMFKINFLLL